MNITGPATLTPDETTAIVTALRERHLALSAERGLVPLDLTDASAVVFRTDDGALVGALTVNGEQLATAGLGADGHALGHVGC